MRHNKYDGVGGQGWVLLGLMVISLLFALTVECLRYNECRAHGFSILYCAGDR